MTLLHGVSQLVIGNVHLRSHLSIRVTFVAMYTQQLVVVSIGEIQSTSICNRKAVIAFYRKLIVFPSVCPANRNEAGPSGRAF